MRDIMTMKKVSLLICLSVFMSQTVVADEDFNFAVQETQKDLKDKNKRKDLLNTKEAKDADTAAKSIAGSEANTEEIYAITADLAAIIGEQAAGDPGKMQQLLKEATENPKVFFERLPAAQQERIKSLSKKIESRKYPLPKK